MLFRSLITLSLIILSSCALHAAATLDNLKAGSYVNGTALDTKDLEGRVVIFEYWGVMCPPCLASISHLVALQEKYGRDRLVIVANQCQSFDDEKSRATWKKHGGDNTISVINHGSLSGAKVSGIPHCFVFSHEGKLLYEGSPGNLDPIVEEAIQVSPGFLVAGHTYTKTAKQAAVIGAMNSNFKTTLKSLRSLSEGDDESAKEEATYLLNKVTTYANEYQERLTKIREQDVLSFSEQLAKIVNLLRGDELGKPFEDQLNELKKDKEFQSELKAASALQQVVDYVGKQGASFDADGIKSNEKVVLQAASNLQQIVKKYPDSKAAKKATELLNNCKL